MGCLCVGGDVCVWGGMRVVCVSGCCVCEWLCVCEGLRACAGFRC